MKSILLLFLILPLISISQVMPMGNGIYTLSKHGSTGFTSLGKLRKKAYEAAKEYAKQNNATAEVISVNETKAGFAVWPQVDLQFRLVKNSKEEKSGDKNSDLQPKHNDSDKLERLEKIGQMYKDSVLTKEEFEAEKKKILSEY